MSHCNIQNPKTKQWRCWSTVVDDWISDWMDEAEYKDWFVAEHGRQFRYLVENGIQPSKNYSYEWCVFTRALYEQKCGSCKSLSRCGSCPYNVSYEYYKEHGLDFLDLKFD